jgi:hypothetical protein
MLGMTSCPICQKAVTSRARNESFPFCSARCKQVDLHAWLHEQYRVPAEETPEDDVEAPSRERESN